MNMCSEILVPNSIYFSSDNGHSERFILRWKAIKICLDPPTYGSDSARINPLRIITELRCPYMNWKISLCSYGSGPFESFTGTGTAC